MRHEMLTQRAPFCIGAMAKKGTLSQHFVMRVVPPLVWMSSLHSLGTLVNVLFMDRVINSVEISVACHFHSITSNFHSTIFSSAILDLIFIFSSESADLLTKIYSFTLPIAKQEF